MKKIITILIFVSAALPSTKSIAQGCSDAGFCTIGNLAARADSLHTTRHQLKLILPIGVGDEDVFVFSPAIEYNLQLSAKWIVQGKLTTNYATGDLGSAVGLGDVFLSATHLFNPSAKWKTSATLGAKLPLNQGNLKEGNRSLPMQYQSSLGTIDVIAGIAIASHHWQFAAGLQQPLTGINRNNFLPVYWDDSVANNYPPTNDFNRKGDLLFRSGYTFSAHQKWRFNGGLLGIYHLGEDTYIDANISTKPIPIKGSKGITLNATAGINYQVNKKIGIGISGGVPLVVRDVRPDGLTRSFVFSPEISIQF